MKSLWKIIGRLLLIVAGLVVPLLALEMGVHLLGLAPPADPDPAIWEPHPLFGWWHIPHNGGIFHSSYNEFEAEVQINARGLRDREIGYDNPTGAFRILSLADSFGEALQVDLADTYHKQLETLLADSLNRPVEVLNAGVGGWGTDQEAIFYVAEGFRYQPDIVLLAFFTRNDAVNNYGPLEIARNGGSQQKEFFTLSQDGKLIPPVVQEKQTVFTELNQVNTGFGQPLTPDIDENAPPLLGLSDTLWRGLALYRFLVPYLRDIPAVIQWLGPSGILGGEGVVRAGHPATPIPFFVYQSPPDEDFEAAWALTEAIIVRLRDEVEQRGARLVVVIVAAPEQVYPEAWARTLAAHPAMQTLNWDLAAPNRRLAGFLAKQGIPYLDLLPVFREAALKPDSPSLHFRHDQHWTVEGHRLAAPAIHDFLMQEISLGVGK
ncbi:MAG: SGNH/GDSL hydrolase family protein [Anaerolineae bacterium]|nr:SGNH/GDSL hydrolase family protein [Anaerolineae bacterium]